MVTTYCPRMGLESTLKDQSSRKSIHVVHANHHGGKTPGESGDLGLKLQNIVNARAGKRYLAIIKVAEITDSGRSGTNRRFEDILDHYCPAKNSGGHRNPLKISVITHARSENDLN